MDFPDDEIQELKALHGSVQRADEGGVTFFMLPLLHLPEGCSPERVDSLLCPTARDGYSSRLFFAEKPHSRSTPNWNGQVRILERNWYAFSWRIQDPAPLRLAQMVQVHLRGLR
jgi:hypothetical protein